MARRFSYRRMTPQQLLVVIVLAVVALLVRQWGPQAPSRPGEIEPGVYQVERAVDGDTLLLANGVRVRLVGANTPETVKPNSPVEPWGPEASQYTKDFISGGEVRLEFDPGERLDKYDRVLAYVWVGDRMLNEELIREGLARFEPQYRYSSAMKARFRQAEREAKSAGRGIWSGR